MKYYRGETLKGIIAVLGMLSIPTLIVKDRIKKIRLEEEEKRITQKIVKNTMMLEESLNNKKVLKYIDFIKNTKIPQKILCKNIILNGYDIIKNKNSIDNTLKLRLKHIMELKGIREEYKRN